MKPILAILTSNTALGGMFYGQTFEVVDIHPGGRVSLKINGATVDFSFREVLIVNIQGIAQTLYDSKNWGATQYDYVKMPCSPTVRDLYISLELYADKIGLRFKAQYNCPA